VVPRSPRVLYDTSILFNLGRTGWFPFSGDLLLRNATRAAVPSVPILLELIFNSSREQVGPSPANISIRLWEEIDVHPKWNIRRPSEQDSDKEINAVIVSSSARPVSPTWGSVSGGFTNYELDHKDSRIGARFLLNSSCNRGRSLGGDYYSDSAIAQ
jgi:hypothetical protein